LFSWLSMQKVTLCPAIIGELQVMHEHYCYLNEKIAAQDAKIVKQVKESSRCQLLKTVPGIGGMTASQLAAEVGNAHQFKNGRKWLPG
ncbi:transposase, partial [Amphritea sp.]|uniref:transposase n=1 Tax=Amphritea sp. TaxID=1872502 RepID=UPI003A9357BA